MSVTSLITYFRYGIEAAIRSGVVKTFPGSQTMGAYHPSVLELELADTVRKRGYAITTIERVLGGSRSEEIFQAFESGGLKYHASVAKEYIEYAYGGDAAKSQRFSLVNPFFKIGIEQSLLNIAAAVTHSDVVYSYLELNRTKHAGSLCRAASQRWHRDPAITSYVKFFIYLNDVDENSGPFEYAERTHKNSNFRRYPNKNFGYGGRYLTAEEERVLERVAPLRRFTGKRGTLVIADTSGFHRGGFVMGPRSIRHMLTIGYYPKRECMRVLFSLDGPDRTEAKELSSAQLIALNLR